ncbi:MAG: NAD(P)-dependent alcohol dehydrogenase [Sandaracinus sp.]|nr:NAD(P)-dependent alcohol dehydrogenase [Sandaracinus sp.]MCB9619679.1 NAD(P)-dependent alcohol dehydrogenase [Sandaracinus sp.]MCB9634384.1 NAD(P)-dependent alcohol dehydrogenase [Sandaracinus sp.]
MRAIVHSRYGSPDVLETRELPTPEPRAGEVLVRVRAASINAADYRLMRADPWLVRLENGLFAPKKWPVLGSDFAGEVAAVGDCVADFQVGDRVFGDAFRDGRGTFAEHVRVGVGSLARMPEGLSFDEAAALPLAGTTALQALRDGSAVRPGERVLIHGAGGGVGGFAVQLAKAYGAHVTAVCSAKSASRLVGADVILDYAREDFATDPEGFDVIVVVNGRRSPSTYKRALRAGGRLVVVGGTNRQIFEGLLLAPLVFLFSGKRARTLHLDSARQAADLRELAEHVRTGALRVCLDRRFRFEDTIEAMRYVERGHLSGKVVLQLGSAA